MDAVRIERKPPLRLVRLDAGKRNVLTLEAVEALASALVEDAEAPVVVLSGRPDGFSVGLDNATLASGELEREQLLTRMGELLLSTLEGPTRLVSVCEGHAVAAGAMLLLVSDHRIGAPGHYKVGFTEPRIGMPLPTLPVLLARERLDRRQLHALTVLGRTVGPEGALSAGFLDELAAPDTLDERALAAAEDLAQLSDGAYRGSLANAWGPAIESLRSMIDAQRRRLEAARARNG